jgi:hypothetical protein
MLKTVTMTGADDDTRVEDLVGLSKRFPFVEWGILASRMQMGAKRFPTAEWANRFAGFASENELRVSMHLCGGWVRELLLGELKWSELPHVLLGVAQRVQINTHAEAHVSRTAMMANLIGWPLKTFIFQWDGVNDHLAYAAQAYGIRVNALFDTSHGAGALAGSWPRSVLSLPCGYAGGLSADNVAEQLGEIEKASGGLDYWIDMEGRIRDRNGCFDLEKVEQVLTICEPLVAREPPL